MLKSAVGRSCSGGGETHEGSLTQEKIHPSLRQGTGVKASYWEVLRGGMALGVWRLGRRGGGVE